MTIPDYIPTIPNFFNTGSGQLNDVTNVTNKINEGKEILNTLEKYMIIGAVALAAIGIVMAATAGMACVIPIVMATALLYGAVNLNHVKSNIEEIIGNPAQYIDVNPSDQSVKVSADKIKEKLKENTFFFNWAIDLIVDYSLKPLTE